MRYLSFITKVMYVTWEYVSFFSIVPIFLFKRGKATVSKKE